MIFAIGDRVIATLEGWFYGHAGSQYRGIFGTVRAIHGDGAFAHVEIGNVTVLASGIIILIRCDEPPPKDVVEHDGQQHVSHIYNADELSPGVCPSRTLN